jgi:hypothetical protein
MSLEGRILGLRRDDIGVRMLDYLRKLMVDG